MCPQCRFADLHEYMCHVTLVINGEWGGMSQLPVGNQESRAGRWAPDRTGGFERVAAANQRRLCLPVKVG